MTTELAVVAQELIQENGRDVTLHLSGATPSDALQPWRGARSDPATHPGTTVGPLRAVFIAETQSELTRALFSALSGSGGVPPRRSSSTFLVAGLDLGTTDPRTIDAVVDGDLEWRVTGVDIVKPGDVLYLVTLEVAQ